MKKIIKMLTAQFFLHSHIIKTLLLITLILANLTGCIRIEGECEWL
jgi:hypothetical protein